MAAKDLCIILLRGTVVRGPYPLVRSSLSPPTRAVICIVQGLAPLEKHIKDFPSRYRLNSNEEPGSKVCSMGTFRAAAICVSMVVGNGSIRTSV